MKVDYGSLNRYSANQLIKRMNRVESHLRIDETSIFLKARIEKLIEIEPQNSISNWYYLNKHLGRHPGKSPVGDVIRRSHITWRQQFAEQAIQWNPLSEDCQRVGSPQKHLAQKSRGVQASQEVLDKAETHCSGPCTIARRSGWRAMSHQGVDDSHIYKIQSPSPIFISASKNVAGWIGTTLNIFVSSIQSDMR